MNDEKKYYSVYEMARQMNVSSTTIYRWIDDGLKAEKRARGRMVRLSMSMDDVNEFLMNNPELQQ